MDKIKKNALITICIVSIMQCVSAAGGFVIDSYHVDMQLTASGSMYIQEHIDVNFSEKKHGIFRNIPVEDKVGDYIVIDNFRVIGGPIAGEDIDGENYSIKIGDPNITVIGKKSYIISYTVHNAIKRYLSGNNSASGAWQELYWNVIGHNRDTSIAKSSFTITLPKKHMFNNKQMFLFYGSNGEKNTSGSTFIQTNTGLIMGAIYQKLTERQGATIGLQFPDKYFLIDSEYYEMFNHPSSTDNTFENVDKFYYPQGNGNNNFSSDLPIPGLRLFVGFFSLATFMVLYINRGTDGSYWKSKKAVTIYYVPPKKPIAPIAFYYRYFDVEPKIFAATIYHRASRGLITISKSEALNKAELMKMNPGKTKEDAGLRNRVVSMSTEDNKVYLVKNMHAVAKADKREQEYIKAIFGDNDAITIDAIKHSYIELLFELIHKDTMDTNLYTTKTKFLQINYYATEEGEKLFEHIRGYKNYIEKVEKKVLRNELKNNPDLVNTLLPRATLFGQESKILDIIEELMIPINWYDNDSSSSISESFSILTTGLVLSATSPEHGISSGRSGGSDWSDSSDSGFSSDSGGSSGDGGGGGGGGSW